MTVGYRVDNTKIPHKIPQGIYVIIEDFKTKYQDKIGKMKFPRGEVYEYLGTTLDYRMIGELNIYTTNYVKKTIQEYPENLSTSEATLASEYLFKTKNNTEKIMDKPSQYFYTTLSRGIFLSNKVKQEIQTVIIYLFTREKDTNTNDWKKLTP